MEKDSKMLVRVQLLEERVAYLESIIKGFQCQTQSKNYDINEVRENIVITHHNLSQILQTSMEEQIILMIIDINKKTPFMKMAKELSMYNGAAWIHMEDSDLKLFIETIEHKILLFHSNCPRDVDTHFDNNKIIYGLNLMARFKKIKNKLIDNI